MNQLPLLTVRRQPIQPEPKIPTKTIKAYVRENLRDFPKRQAERERVRELYQKSERPRKPKPKELEHSFMKTIQITFRAVFEQPTGPLNPLGAKMPGAQPVEIFRKGEFWYARELSTPKRNVFVRLGNWSSSDAARQGVENSFVRRLQSWQVWGTPPDSPVPCPLTSDQICDLGDGKAGWYQPEDRTHIIDPPNIEGNPRIPPAACGATGLPSKCFVNNRANVRPSCKACAEIWERDYKTK